MPCPKFRPGQVPMDQAVPGDAPAHLRSREDKTQLALPTVPPRQAGKADHLPAPPVIKSDWGTDALALGTRKQVLSNRPETQRAPAIPGVSDQCLGPPGNEGGIKNKILNTAAEGKASSCRGGSAGLVLAEKGSSEYPLEKVPGQTCAMELRSGEPSGKVKEREKGKRAHR